MEVDPLRHETNFRELLWAMSQPQTFYVLGAGASYGLIPTTQQMRAVIQREYAAFGMYPAKPSQRSALHDRVIGSIPRAPNDTYDAVLSELLLRNIQPGALEFLVQRALYLPAEAIAPPQYAVFDVVGSSATLFNFNLDGLASTFCSYKHIVIEPHGRIDRLWFENGTYEFWCEATMAFDVELPHITPKLLPSPEPEGLIASSAYTQTRRLFCRSPAMVIVGYSFGKAEGGLDDFRSWQFFVELLKAFPRPTFVLSPFPEELADTLRQALSSSDVLGIPIYWETLAACLVGVAGQSQRLPSFRSNDQLRDLMYQYEEMADRR